MVTPTWASARRVRLVLLFLLLGLGAGALPIWAAWQSPPPAPVWPNTACVSRTERGVGFEFLGYQTQPDGTTVLAVRITNPQRLALDALGFTSAGWQRVAPTEGSTYPGQLGTYSVQWVLDLVLPKQAAFRFRPQGNWFQKGASETFVLTVRTFDAQQPLVAWARANLQLAVLRVRPADFPCLLVLPTPTPTLTPTLTPTPTPPFSPLPAPTPLGQTLPQQAVLPACTFPGSAPPAIKPLSAYNFSEPQVVITHTAPMGIAEWLPDNQTLLITLAEVNHNFNSIDTFNTQTRILKTYAQHIYVVGGPLWVPTLGAVIYVDGANSIMELRVSTDNSAQTRLIANDPFGYSLTLSPDGHRFAFTFPWNGATKPYIWDADNNSVQAVPIDLARWRYAKYPNINATLRPAPFNLAWRPDNTKIAFFSGLWLFLWDTGDGTACQIDLGTRLMEPRMVGKTEWSPDGRYLAIRTYVAELGAETADELAVLDMQTGELKLIRLPLPRINNRAPVMQTFAWTPDSQNITVLGRVDMVNGLGTMMGLHLLNVVSSEFQRVLPARIFEIPGDGQELAWSPNGDKLAIQCDASTPDYRDFVEDRICLLAVQTNP